MYYYLQSVCAEFWNQDCLSTTLCLDYAELAWMQCLNLTIWQLCSAWLGINTKSKLKVLPSNHKSVKVHHLKDDIADRWSETPTARSGLTSKNATICLIGAIRIFGCTYQKTLYPLYSPSVIIFTFSSQTGSARERRLTEKNITRRSEIKAEIS